MAPSHFLQVIVDGAAGGCKRERFFDLARHPFLATDQEFQLLRQRTCARDFSGEGSNTLGRNTSCAPNQIFQFTYSRVFILARSGKKMLQLVIFDLGSKAVERNYTGPLGLQQQIQNFLQHRLHVVKLPVTTGLRKPNTDLSILFEQFFAALYLSYLQ